jgi:CRISPR-associated endonuclease Cas2
MKRIHRVVIISYDIPDDARREKVASVILRYGNRVQYSVFAVTASQLKLSQLHRELLSVIDVSADSILVIDIGTAEGAASCVTVYGVPVHGVGPLPSAWSV